MQKTPSAPQWVWSTFEQVNNVPGPGADGHPAFYEPSCTTRPKNQQSIPGTPNQIVRVRPIPSTDPDCTRPQSAVDNIQKLNADVQSALKKVGSVFQRYELINTQWPLQPTDVLPPTMFQAQPSILANTTMESFIQSTSSCMGCHSMARTVNADQFVSSDFSFTINNAEPKLPSNKIISPPKALMQTPWDKKNWKEIIRGYELATKTYEQLPHNVPIAKLHCASCHLNAGGNADAAWWVNLNYKYKTKEALEERINQCFEQSMNGKALRRSAEKGGSQDSQDMEAFLTYIHWLDEQWKGRQGESVPHGFPSIQTRTGNPLQGQRIFEQKCAFCHQADGQGRYERDVYFRPALWGPHSYKSTAGMFTDVQYLAAFIRWNMPLGSGGQLTDHEAWDIAVFIDAQNRPGKKNSEVDGR